MAHAFRLRFAVTVLGDRDNLNSLALAARAALEDLLNHVATKVDLMNSPDDRRRGWQIGTGMIESTRKQLVGIRLKDPGMHWSEQGAIAVTALRAIDLNGKWNPFWNTLALPT